MKKGFLSLLTILTILTTFTYFPCFANDNDLSFANEGALSFDQATTSCTATIDENLVLHIPYISYVYGFITITFTADFQYIYYSNSPSAIPFRLTNASVISNPSLTCIQPTISSDLTIHIPDVVLPDGITHIFVDLIFDKDMSTSNNQLLWVVSNYGLL